jgi:hypothetical protein
MVDFIANIRHTMIMKNIVLTKIAYSFLFGANGCDKLNAMSFCPFSCQTDSVDPHRSSIAYGLFMTHKQSVQWLLWIKP